MSKVKIHDRATVIYACKQKARGSRVTVPVSETQGTISISGTACVGTGTNFVTQATEGAYIYNTTGYELGRVLTITDATNLTLYEAPPLTTVEASPTTTKKLGIDTGNFSNIAYSFGLGNAHAVRVQQGLKFTFESTTGTATYVGDELDRYEQTWVKDEFVKVEFTTFVPTLGAVKDPSVIAVNEIPLPDVFQATGLGVVLGSTAVDYTNSVSSGDVIEVEYRLSSPDLVTHSPYNATEKVYFSYDLIGQLDLDITGIGEKGTYKFTFSGNSGDIVMLPRRVPDYASQSLDIAEPFNSSAVNSNIKLVALDLVFAQKAIGFGMSGTDIILNATNELIIAGLTFTATADVTVSNILDIWGSLPSGITFTEANALKASTLVSANVGSFTAGTLTGYSIIDIGSETELLLRVTDIDTNINSLTIMVGDIPLEATIRIVDPYAYREKPTVSNLCIGKLTAPNLTGRDIQRFQLSCETGFYQGAIPSDITVSVKEDIEGIFFKPNRYIGVEAILWVAWGNEDTNSLVTLHFSKVTISKVPPSTIGNFKAFDVAFRNIGNYTMTLS